MKLKDLLFEVRIFQNNFIKFVKMKFIDELCSAMFSYKFKYSSALLFSLPHFIYFSLLLIITSLLFIFIIQYDIILSM